MATVPKMNFGLPMVNAMATVMSVFARLQQSDNANAIAKAEAQQFIARANATRAVGSHQAQRLMRANARLRGKQMSVLAASGFSATDSGAETIKAETLEEQSIQELLLVAQAEQEARNDDYRATLRRQQGRDERTAGRYGAVDALVSGVTSWRERFGSPQDDPAEDDAFNEDPLLVPFNEPDPRVDPYHRRP